MKTEPIALVLALLLLAPAWSGAGGRLAFEMSVPETSTQRLHLTLADAVREALAVNPELLALQHTAEEKQREAKATARTRWGAVEAVASYSRLNDDQVVRPISREILEGGFAALPFDRNQFHYGVRFQVPLYLGGKLSGRTAVAPR